MANGDEGQGPGGCHVSAASAPQDIANAAPSLSLRLLRAVREIRGVASRPMAPSGLHDSPNLRARRYENPPCIRRAAACNAIRLRRRRPRGSDTGYGAADPPRPGLHRLEGHIRSFWIAPLFVTANVRSQDVDPENLAR